MASASSTTRGRATEKAHVIAGGPRSSSTSSRPSGARRRSAAPLETEHLAHAHVTDHRLLEEKPRERPALHHGNQRKVSGAETLERRRQRIVRADRREIFDARHHFVDRCDRPALLLHLAQVADRDEADHPVARHDRDRTEVQGQDAIANERTDRAAGWHGADPGRHQLSDAYGADYRRESLLLERRCRRVEPEICDQPIPEALKLVRLEADPEDLEVPPE